MFTVLSVVPIHGYYREHKYQQEFIIIQIKKIIIQIKKKSTVWTYLSYFSADLEHPANVFNKNARSEIERFGEKWISLSNPKFHSSSEPKAKTGHRWMLAILKENVNKLHQHEITNKYYQQEQSGHHEEWWIICQR